ncbi:DNA polymerase III subunit delta [Thermodesulfobacteriota bacterium]
MQGEFPPEKILAQIDKGLFFPVYFFYGQGEFRMERLLARMKEAFVPPSARDLDLHIYYGGKQGSPDYTNPVNIIDAARSFPFLAERRLIIVRRADDFNTADLDYFLEYLEDPVDTSSVIFQVYNADFRKKFYKMIKKNGIAVNFKVLYDNQILPWILRLAKEKGIDIERKACEYLQETVGNKLRDLNSELEKIHLLYGNSRVGIEEVKSIAIHSKKYSVFELMDEISLKRCSNSLTFLKKFLEEEDHNAPLGLLGMLERQIRLLWQTHSITAGGGKKKDVVSDLHLQPFQVEKLTGQVKNWEPDGFERALILIHEADGRLKSGHQADLILENLVINLCL